MMGLWPALAAAQDTASAPAELLGTFGDDYGSRYRVSATLFEHLPRAKYHIVSWHAAERYLIARNDSANVADKGLWTRIDWLPLEGMAPYTWGFCLTAYRAATEQDARNTPTANRSMPRTGCNRFPFTRMQRVPGDSAR
ncbi:MAG TPA: hypothetical protein VGE27_18945 [Gemmatimonas sp.]|uniref:hypothetical protein n=1 Tax=Gemmatimonas sp. TaxID=1962908 RepID=UPI002ED83603